uniref:Uncharacterized protein n=1 Tax=viral metagenome TaxID=1070528 RepID=A0A6C0LEF6_9ZZZZ
MDIGVVFHINNIPEFSQLVKNDASETLKLNKIIFKTKNNEYYTLIRYNKYLLTEDLISTVGLLKCLVLNSQLLAIGFAPPKALSYTTFLSRYPSNTSDIIAEEFVDGVMINVFWNPTLNLAGDWEIATRNSVGATILCGKKTYYSLFKETIQYVNLDVRQLNPLYSYSFVMQHQDISSSFTNPALYLIEMYEILQTPDKSILVFPLDQNKTRYCEYWKTTTVQFPALYDFLSYDEMKQKYASITTPYYCKGVVIKNLKTYHRTKLLNPAYQYVKQIKGAGEKELYKYLYLRHYGKIKDFLQMNPNPNNTIKFSKFRSYIHEFSHELHRQYIACHVKKQIKKENVIKIYQSHLQNLHSMYMDQLRLEKGNVCRKVVKDYVNRLKPDTLLFCLNSFTSTSTSKILT